MTIICQGYTAGENWSLYQGDCVEIVRQMPPNSIDFAVYSPPFSSLYIYSDSERDMGNAASDEEFAEHYGYLCRELYRALRPGRCIAVHCKQLVYYKNQRGTAGLRDFRGDLNKAHAAAGFDLHSEVTIWKCPVVEMQRTKAHGLLYKQLRTDSTYSRAGLAEYLQIYRKWAGPGDEGLVKPVTHDVEEFPLDQWQEWASPVWMTVRQTNVLNTELAREDRDEKHICPLQLDVIERALVLYSNPGDVVLSPFAGIGSEGFMAVRRGRRFVGVELKESYCRQAERFLREAERDVATPDLLSMMRA